MQKEKAQSGILYGIGVGPGEPELLTHKAVQVIECCDTIVVPSEPIEECNAFQIVENWCRTYGSISLWHGIFP